ncbi:MAG: ribonuclease R, partial [Phascolarctobacterium sp.]|nr:ribonuclease R [Phascolarctobacterium sp.]
MQRKDIKEIILEFMRNGTYAPMTAEDLLDALAGECSATKFWNELIALEKNGQIIKTRFETYGLPEKMGLVTGRLQLTSKGFGFVIPDNKGD